MGIIALVLLIFFIGCKKYYNAGCNLATSINNILNDYENDS